MTRRVNKLEDRLAASKQYEEQKAMPKIHTKIYCSKRLNDKDKYNILKAQVIQYVQGPPVKLTTDI